MKKSFLRPAIVGGILVAAGFGVQAATTYTFQEGVNAYSGTLDTQIRGATPDRDDGALESLSIDGSDGGGQNHVLLRFDKLSGAGAGQIPPGSKVIAATLTLHFVDGGDDPALHRMLVKWDEAATWNMFDAVTVDGVTPDDIEAAYLPDVQTIEAGRAVPYFETVVLPVQTIQDWLDGKAPNYGWVFVPSGGGGADFDSSESATPAFRPLLTITVGTSGEPTLSSVVLADGATDVAVSSNIEFTITEDTFKVNPSSVQLTVNGQTVQPTVTNDAATGQTRIVYDPVANFAGNSKVTVKLVFGDTASPAHVTTNQFTFTTRPLGTMLVAIDDKQIWRYDRSGADLGTAWKEKIFNDNSWPQGPALIADESGATAEPIRTAISRMDDAGNPVTTFYFRTHFNFTGNPAAILLSLRHVVDDGAIFYLNGTEISRFGFSAGTTVTFDQFASGHENAYAGPFNVSTDSLVVGDNVLAVEVHQSDIGSSDIVFGAILEALAPDPNDMLLVAIDDKQVWRYDRSGTDLGTAWKEKTFNDGAWPQGKALIADETGATAEPIRTPIDRFNDAAEHVTTFYFRSHFNFAGDPAGVQLRLRHVVDDGAVFYLNGA
ncbi:MAG: Ig-like domain-containing protein [Verrucomicrobia bacterium]|nr:Ig-like domain-containing protein [Verrucomicrobiota bacterium]